MELKEGVATTIERVAQLLALTEDLMTIAETQNDNGSSILSNLLVSVQFANMCFLTSMMKPTVGS